MSARIPAGTAGGEDRMTRKLGIMATVIAALAITTSLALAAITWQSGPT
jgi:hypothetical protein